MGLFNSIVTGVLRRRMSQIEAFVQNPHQIQAECLKRLINQARDTVFGRERGFNCISSPEVFKNQVELSTYEQLFPYIERVMKGEQGVLWPSKVKWFAKSSGTTNARSKFIPVTPESLRDCHYKAGKDLIGLYINNYPDTRMFDGKSLAIGGSHQLNDMDRQGKSRYGDVSAVIMANLPWWAEYVRTPSLELALMDEWEEKIGRMAQIVSQRDVTSLQGVPTWTVVLLKRILEIRGAEHVLQVWPNLEVFVHGAVAFQPYESVFRTLLPSADMRYMEAYNASEGFFGIQDQIGSKDMLLMLDYGIYYEFIPLEEIEKVSPRTLELGEVEPGETYELVVSTNGGLWRYRIGDTIKFTSINPYRIRITGRTKHFINAFGEEVVIENADHAITRACYETASRVRDFTAAPRYMDGTNKGGHEWLIEFEREPSDIAMFSDILDRALREVNSDYDAKRYKDIALEPPIVHSLAQGTFYYWMKLRGKLGGQNKVPRLSNSREFVDDILGLVPQTT